LYSQGCRLIESIQSLQRIFEKQQQTGILKTPTLIQDLKEKMKDLHTQQSSLQTLLFPYASWIKELNSPMSEKEKEKQFAQRSLSYQLHMQSRSFGTVSFNFG
jgi:phenylacetate-coenzyme A ligase PaaK-like adenylate-forming protein